MAKFKELKKQALTLPHQPGVYQYWDAQEQVIYVGKAKDLHKRVNSYFKQESDLKTNLMLAQATKITYTITPTEIDALTLEDRLVNQYQPKYNILLKHDSSFRYICLSKTNPPQIQSSRKPLPQQTCLGPFPFATYDIVKIARDIIALTQYQTLAASHWELYNNKQAWQEKYYPDFIKKLVQTIKYGDQSLLKLYQAQMQQHAQKLEFEQARDYKNKIELLTKFTQRTSQLVANRPASEHLIICQVQNDQFLIFVFSLQDGLLHFLKEFKLELNAPSEIMEAFLKQYYSTSVPPRTIAIYDEDHSQLTIDPAIADYLNQRWHSSTQIKVVLQHKLLKLALQNVQAKTSLKNRLDSALKNLLNLPSAPQSIDFIDISNLGSQIIVGGAARFENGKPTKKLWRHYKMKSFSGQDDYASIRELVTRRYQKINWPDLLVIDGGLGQLNSAIASLPANYNGMVVSLAKSEETLIFSQSRQIQLSLKNLADQFIIKGRDSVHNFVVGYTRKSFKKIYKTSALDHINGIGPTTKLKLLKHFKSLEKIKQATLSELTQVIGQHKARLIYAGLNLPVKI